LGGASNREFAGVASDHAGGRRGAAVVEGQVKFDTLESLLSANRKWSSAFNRPIHPNNHSAEAARKPIGPNRRSFCHIVAGV